MTKRMTKKQMVMDVLAALGPKATNPQIKDWIKERFDTYVHPTNYTVYRKQYAKNITEQMTMAVVPRVLPDRTGKMIADEGKFLTRPHAANHPKPSLLVIHLRALIEEYGAEEVGDMLKILSEI